MKSKHGRVRGKCAMKNGLQIALIDLCCCAMLGAAIGPGIGSVWAQESSGEQKVLICGKEENTRADACYEIVTAESATSSEPESTSSPESTETSAPAVESTTPAAAESETTPAPAVTTAADSKTISRFTISEPITLVVTRGTSVEDVFDALPQTLPAADENGKAIEVPVTWKADGENVNATQITYEAGKGGTVSLGSETISDTAELKGSTAQADEGYSFVSWTDESGNVVAASKTFVPANVSKDITYTASFESSATASTAKSESKMPASSFTGYASNGVTVAAAVDEGVFPAGTTMQVTAVSTDEAIQAAQSAVSGEIVDAAAVNIAFYDAGGNEIQPADNTQVHVTLTSSNKVGGSEYSLIHIGENGAEKIADASATGASFDADSFSIYAIIGQLGGKATITYEFYNDATTPNLLSTCIVKDGDTLVAPGTPVSAAVSSAAFLGWSTADAPAEYQTFGTVTIPSTVTSNTTVKLYARFSEQTYRVFFHNQYGAILQSFSVGKGSSFHVADYNSYVTFPIPTDQALISWSTILAPSGTQTGLGGEDGAVADLTITGDVNLYPVLASAFWITFDSNGGSYTATEFFRLGSNTEAPTEPTRPGYTFEGWYTDETLTQQYTFGTPLSADIALHAKWTVNEVSYTVIYWVEALDSNKNYVAGNYEYKASQTMQAVVDSQVSIGVANVGRSYPYYTFDHGDQNVTVDGDGSTVVNAYFHLNTYTFIFNLADVSSGSSTRTTTLTIGGSAYTASNPYSFAVHVGENIAGRWPTAGNIATFVTGSGLASQFYAWKSPSLSTNYVTKRLTVTADLLSSADDNSVTTYTALYQSSMITYYINYWLENANDTGYTLSAEYSQEAFAPANASWGAKQIGGFTNISGPPDGYPASDTTTCTYHFYYTRNTYSLEFSNYGTIETTISPIKYGAGISGYDYTPARPLSLSSDYQFGGWYTTPTCLDGTEFDFSSAVMPSRNLILYAKWALPDYTVRFDLNGGTSSKIADQTDVFGRRLFCPDPPTRAGYVFSGWTLGGKAFSFDGLIAGNVLDYAVDGVITLQAQWIGGSILLVKYDAGEGTNAPTDSRAYYSGTKVVVAEASTPPDGEYFLYWTLDGINYYPGETITIETASEADGIMTLTAVYGEAQSASITYHPNGGSGCDYTTDSVQNNTEITILACNDSKINYCRDGYIFTGWNTKANGSGTSYAAGTTAYIDNIGGNDLYALWTAVEQAPKTVTQMPKTGDDNKWMTSLIALSIGVVGLCMFVLILCRSNSIVARTRASHSRKAGAHLPNNNRNKQE